MVKDSIVTESDLDDFTATAKAIAFDTCHKIYVLMDDQQVELMREYGYDALITSDEMTPRQMSDKVAEWYSQSCGLRFISAVATVPINQGDGFTSIVSQEDGWKRYDDEDEDED
jgi:hypothetical protein